MKKQLLGTSALVAAGMLAAGGPVAAQQTNPLSVSISGFASQFITWSNQYDRGTTGANTPSIANTSSSGGSTYAHFDQYQDTRLVFRGTVAMANGITAGFQTELTAPTSGGIGGDQIRQNFAFLSGAFGEFRLGSQTGAARNMHQNAYAEVWRRGGTFADAGPWNRTVQNVTGSPLDRSTINGTNADMYDVHSEKITYYTPRMAGFQFGYSYAPEFSQDRGGAPPLLNGAQATYNRSHSFGVNYVNNLGGVDIRASAGFVTAKIPDEQISCTTTTVGGSVTSPAGAPTPSSTPTPASLATGAVTPSTLCSNGTSVRDDPRQYLAALQLGYQGFRIGGAFGAIKNGRVANVQNGASVGAGGGASTTNGLNGTIAAFPNAQRMQGHAFSAALSYTMGPAAVALAWTYGNNNDCPTGTPTFTPAAGTNGTTTAVSVTGNDEAAGGVTVTIPALTSTPQASVTPASNQFCSGKDRMSVYAITGSYTLGPGVFWDAALFHVRWKGNNGGSSAANFNYDQVKNTGTGVITGLILTF